ncbi:MAG: response regulator transcription factor [Propionibacteriaceae bacterium]|nr:response regulator transcription factor [Propionibacteriaceae bacterium]
MRLVVAEDSVLLREGLVRLFAELGHDVVAAVGDAPSLVAAVDEHVPDIAVTDVRMPPTHTDDGLRAAVSIRASHPGVGLLVLSQWVEADAARELLSSGRGAVGYLLKDRVQDLATVATALDVIAHGGMMVDPQVIAQVSVGGVGLDRLTGREREVLALMAQGRSNTAIAAQLVVTQGAVEKHIASIFTKLDLATSPDDHRRVLAVLRYLGG